MILHFTYEKTNTYRDVTYLHGWEGSPYLGNWINGSLRRYDEELPIFAPGDQLECEALFLDQSGHFVTYEILRILQVTRSEEHQAPTL